METNPVYSQSGNYTALIGLAVTILAHYGLVIDPASVVTVVAGAVALYGIIMQFYAHKKLGVAVGAIKG